MEIIENPYPHIPNLGDIEYANVICDSCGDEFVLFRSEMLERFNSENGIECPYCIHLRYLNNQLK